MSLELALVIKGDQAGAKKAIDDTAAGIEGLGSKAKAAAAPTREVSDAVGQLATDAPSAKTEVEKLGTAAGAAGGQFGGFKAAALGAIGGIAGALAVAGIDALVGTIVTSLVSYYDQVTNSTANIKADLDAHKGLISDIKGLWNEAKGAASSYGLTSKAGLTFESQQNIGRLEPDLSSSLGRLAGSGSVNQNFTRGFEGGQITRSPLEPVMEAIKQDLADGKADIIAWRDEVVGIAMKTPLGSPERVVTEQFLGDSAEAAKVQAELQRAVDLYKGLQGDADAAAAALGKSAEGMTSTGTEAAGALPALREYAALIASIGGGRDVIGPGASFGDIERGGFGFPDVRDGFAIGGYTGHLPTDRIAGYVHGQEYVFDAASTAAIGVGNLDAMRKGVRGYAAGGAVGVQSYSSPLRAGIGLIGESAELANAFSLLRGVAQDFGSRLGSTGNALSAFQGVAAGLASRFLNAAGGMFDKAFPQFGGIGSGISSLLGSLFGGGREAGGPVEAGKFYVVGEKRPELFAPGQSGTILPSTALGGGAPILNVNVFGAPSTPEVRPSSSGGIDIIFREVDRRLSNGTMGKGFAARHGLSRPMKRPG